MVIPVYDALLHKLFARRTVVPLAIMCGAVVGVLGLEITAAEWVDFGERGWFTKARTVARSRAARDAVDRLVQKTDQSRQAKSVWLEDVDALTVCWSRRIGVTSMAESGRLVSWSSPYGIHLVSRADGSPPWAGVRRNDCSVFPRLPSESYSENAWLTLKESGHLVVAASRLFSVLTVPSQSGGMGTQLVALDVGSNAQGRLLWSEGIQGNEIGLAADATCCVSAAMVEAEETLFVCSRDASDGRIVWERQLADMHPKSDRAATPGQLNHFKFPAVHLVQHLVVIMMPSGKLIAIDKKTGVVSWERESVRAEYPPKVLVYENGMASTSDSLLVFVQRRDERGPPGCCTVSLADGSCLKTWWAIPSDLEDQSECVGQQWLAPSVFSGHIVWPAVSATGNMLSHVLVSSVTEPSADLKDFAERDRDVSIVDIYPEKKQMNQESVGRQSDESYHRIVIQASGSIWCLAAVLPEATSGVDLEAKTSLGRK